MAQLTIVIGPAVFCITEGFLLKLVCYNLKFDNQAVMISLANCPYKNTYLVYIYFGLTADANLYQIACVYTEFEKVATPWRHRLVSDDGLESIAIAHRHGDWPQELVFILIFVVIDDHG